MHPLLQNLSIFNWHLILSEEQNAIKFAMEVGLIPSKDDASVSTLNCTKCNGRMNLLNRKDLKLGWRWVCSNRKRKQASDSSTACSGMVNPAAGLFFSNTKVSFQDTLAIVFCFIMKLGVNKMYEHLQLWRASRVSKQMSKNTVVQYYSFCREICEIVSSHNSHLLGGPGKTVDIDQAFLAIKKHRSGKHIVLGVYCQDDKDGVFFLVNRKNKSDLISYIEESIHPDTNIISSDSAMDILKNGKHNASKSKKKKVFCSTLKGEEIRIKHVKPPTDTSLVRYMAVEFYWNHLLKYLPSYAHQVERFLHDIKQVYPGYGKKGLSLKVIDSLQPEAEEMLNAEQEVEVFEEDFDEDMIFVDDLNNQDNSVHLD